jgi:hypothetical protein
MKFEQDVLRSFWSADLVHLAESSWRERVTYKVPVGTDNMRDLTISASKHIKKMKNI